MSVSKDKQRGTWSVYIRYIDWQGNRKVHTKRGFKLKKDALVYERTFLQSKSRDVNMSFENFGHIYLEDKKPRLKYNTYLTKENIIQTKILPYFQNKVSYSLTSNHLLLLYQLITPCRFCIPTRSPPYNLVKLFFSSVLCLIV